MFEGRPLSLISRTDIRGGVGHLGPPVARAGQNDNPEENSAKEGFLLSLIKSLIISPYRALGEVRTARERSLEDVIRDREERVLENHAELVMEARLSRAQEE